MKKTIVVTLLVGSVLSLVGGVMTPAHAAVPRAAVPTPIKVAAVKKVTLLKPAQKKQIVVNQVVSKPLNYAALNASSSTSIAMQAPVEAIKAEKKFNALLLISRGTSLYDFQDGSRKDSMDYMFIPSYKLPFGSISSKIAYSQDLKDESPEASGFADGSITVAKTALKWEWAPPYILTLTPTLTSVVPLSKNSVKRDNLQTALIAGISFGIIPDGISKANGWSLGMGLTAGRNFHQFEESLGGNIILNRYSSNQSINLGYSYEKFSVSAEYIHKTRISYQNTTKDSFEISQEISYLISDNFSVAAGHTNAALSGLKANGSEPSFKFINENDSTVYAQLGISF